MPDLVPYVVLVLGVFAAHGANARIARLLAEDEITEPMRAWLIKATQHKTWTLLRFWPTRIRIVFNADLVWKWAHCPWCCGWWTAWPITAIAWFPIMGANYWWVYGLAAWSVAHAAGRLNHNHGS